MKHTSNWAAFWSVACVVGLTGLAGCGGEDEPNAEPAATVDASADGSSDAALSDDAKAAACRPADANDLLGVCACQKCPVAAYDCLYAPTADAKGCAAIVGCALLTGCTDVASCLTKCGDVLTDAGGAAVVLAQKLQACTVTCIPTPEAGPDAASDAPADTQTSDAPADTQTSDAPADTQTSDAPADTQAADAADEG